MQQARPQPVQQPPAQKPGIAAPDVASITVPSGSSGCNCSCLSNPATTPPVVR
jgi:hypothetical protein